MADLTKNVTPQNTALANPSDAGAATSLFQSTGMHHEQQDVIQFISDAPITNQEYSAPSSIVQLIDSLHAAEEESHTIQKFLSRPVAIKEGTISNDADLASIFVDITTDRLNEVFREKLSGFYAMHCSMKFKLVVNAQPFEAGILALAWAPMYLTVESKYDHALSGTTVERNLPFISGLPISYLNIASQTEATLKVPYVNITPYMNLDTPSDIGRIHIVRFSHIWTNTNSADVPYTLYLSLEDVKLFGATYVPQGIDTINEEHSVSNTLRKVNDIPLLSVVAPEIPAVANAAAAAASALGFSKPYATYSQDDRVRIDQLGGAFNADGKNMGHKLSVMSDCEVSMEPFGFTNKDEMSIQALTTDPGYLYTFTWKTSQVAGTRLSWFHVDPNCYLFDGDAFYPNRLRYVAQMFQYWRGMLSFQFQFAATKFHSGRLRFAFVPAMNITQITYEKVKQYCYSQVFDLRDGTTFDIDVPYMNVAAWRTTQRYRGSDPWFSSLVEENKLVIFVETALRCPENTTDTVEIVTFSSAGPNFEVAVPVAGIFGTESRPFINQFSSEQVATPQEMKKKKKFRLRNLFSPQGINIVTGKETSPTSYDAKPMQFCMGERIESLRPLTRRLELFGTFVPDSPRLLCLSPFYHTTHKQPWSDRTLFSLIRQLFLFQRGSYRFVLKTRNSSVMNVSYTPTLPIGFKTKDFDDGTSPLTYLTYGDGENDWYSQYSMCAIPQSTAAPIAVAEGVVDITVPYYSKYQQVFTLNFGTPDVPYHESYVAAGAIPAGLVLISHSENEGPMWMYRCAADDFSFGGMLGPPKCFINPKFKTWVVA